MPKRYSPTALELYCQMMTFALQMKVVREAVCQDIRQRGGTINNQDPALWIQEETRKQIRGWFETMADVYPDDASKLSRMYESWQKNEDKRL